MAPTVEIKHTPAGVPFARLYLGTDEVTGRAIRPYRSFPDAKDDAEAQAMAERWAESIIEARSLGTGARLGELLDRYVRTIEAANAPANTVRTYRNFVRHVGHLGRMQARGVTSLHIDRLYKELRDQGLSLRTISVFHWFLSGAFHWMQTTGLLLGNPMGGVTKPRWEDVEAEAWEGDDVPRMLAAFDEARQSPYRLRRATAMAATISLLSGTRVGETLALRWRDVAASTRTMRVRGTVTLVHNKPERQSYTKSKRPRAFTVPDDLLSRLGSWKSEQRERGMQVRASDPIITTRGGWVRPPDVSKTFHGLIEPLGLEGPFHQLRHTNATMLLASGMDPRVVQARLGHATVVTTLSLYSHVLPARDFDAAAAIADAVSGYGGLL